MPGDVVDGIKEKDKGFVFCGYAESTGDSHRHWALGIGTEIQSPQQPCNMVSYNSLFNHRGGTPTSLALCRSVIQP